MRKTRGEAGLRFSRVDFYRLRGQDFFAAVYAAISNELGEELHYGKSWAKLNRHQQGVYGWWCFWGDVENGGLVQFYYNCCDVLVPSMIDLLIASGNKPMATLVTQATKIYRKHKNEFAVENPFGDNGLFNRMASLAKLDRPVVRLIYRTTMQIEKWLRANFSVFAVGDNGEPIDPHFSGKIETRHANGNVFEQATIRRGVLSGPYRRYFDNGALEHTCFYAAGEVCADYWPNGQPKHKTMKRGNLKIDEWYYPSGRLQKRYVADKSGYAAEPIRLWHENGQLAEELHTRRGKFFGPHLQFFDDGSRRLEAGHRKNESLVVWNAWDEQRRQVVKNGNGTYFDDGIQVDSSYELFWKSARTRTSELRNGIRHGKETTWSDGVLWSKDEYSKGKLDGVQTLFYDNGRIRTRTTYRNDKAIKTEEFPKFDNPRPAVLMRVEVDRELYEAWKHPSPDVYPSPRNLEKVQASLTIPAFLQEVFERNRTKTLRDEYEDINSFKDGITYFVMVNERGGVVKVEFSGSGVYSGGVINDYPPIIQRLKFNPGRIKGRKVRCQVVVNVDHTFVEGDSAGQKR